jgi:hypothetical protein
MADLAWMDQESAAWEAARLNQSHRSLRCGDAPSRRPLRALTTFEFTDIERIRTEFRILRESEYHKELKNGSLTRHMGTERRQLIDALVSVSSASAREPSILHDR